MNSVILIGRLTKDIELRYTTSQMAVTKFTVAIDEGYGENKKTNFISCMAFGKTAENMERFTGKGKKIGVQGRIQTGSYTNKDGATVYTTDVVADRVEFLEWGDRPSGQGIQSGEAQYRAQAADAIPEGFAAINEDIPF